jgi:hypothetical protein
VILLTVLSSATIYGKGASSSCLHLRRKSSIRVASSKEAIPEVFVDFEQFGVYLKGGRR